MKICIITNRYPANPDDTASPFVRDFTLALRKRGVEVIVFTPDYAVENTEKEHHVLRFKWQSSKIPIGSLSLFNPKNLFLIFSFLHRGRKQLFDLIRRERPDACLALWALPSGWFAYQVKKKFKIPYAVWTLGSDIYVWAKKPIFKQIIKKMLQKANLLFADGFDLAKKTEQLAQKNCRFLPSNRILPPLKTFFCPFEFQKKHFLYVGRWEKAKGLEDLLLATALVGQKNPNVSLSLVGWGSLEKNLPQYIERLNLKNFVKIIGKVSAKELSYQISLCDGVVIPSKGDSIPLVYSEALQMRKPVIVTDVGDMGLLTRKYEVGKVVKPGQVEELACAMLEFISEEKDYIQNMPELLDLINIEKAAEIYLNNLGIKTETRENKVSEFEESILNG